MKKLTNVIIPLFLLSLVSCSDVAKKDITIVYTNDIHGYIANEGGLKVSNVAGYVESLEKEGKDVLLVDAGDEFQGSVYGAIDKGEDMIDIMNAAGYDLATPGNHDFDFGMDAFSSFVEEANYPYVSCNFHYAKQDSTVLEPYKIFDVGGVKIGFVGVSTPTTITSSTPKYFQDENGDFAYGFYGSDNPLDLYEAVQHAIDLIERKVDYVIGLGHLGVGTDEEKKGVTSTAVIRNTKGFDAFIDGHSHTKIENRLIKTKEDKDCLLTQASCYLETFGEMTISSNGEISAKLISETEYQNAQVKAIEDTIVSRVDEEMGKKIAVNENELYVNNPEAEGQRIIRARETNLADLCSDSMYWYLNDSKELDCDIALVNGGGIRKEIKAGDVTLGDVKSTHPFGNQICLIKTKGKNIKDAIEMGSNVIGEWDDLYDCPAENGGFLHIAGMRYKIDADIPSSVTTDENGMFSSVSGEYRVKDLEVYDKRSASYEPLELEKYYSVAGNNYILRNSGNGMSMFDDSENILDYIDEDYVVLAEYIKAFENQTINNGNSPLSHYENYLFDYENPLGSGRIIIENL